MLELDSIPKRLKAEEHEVFGKKTWSVCFTRGSGAVEEDETYAVRLSHKTALGKRSGLAVVYRLLMKSTTVSMAP